MMKGLSELAGLLKTFQEAQRRVEQYQQELSRIRVEGTAGAGMVRVTANGLMRVLECHIDPALLEDNDIEMLEQLLVAAVNQALDKARSESAGELAKVAEEMQIPGLREFISKMDSAK